MTTTAQTSGPVELGTYTVAMIFKVTLGPDGYRTSNLVKTDITVEHSVYGETSTLDGEDVESLGEMIDDEMDPRNLAFIADAFPAPKDVGDGSPEAIAQPEGEGEAEVKGDDGVAGTKD